MIGRKGRALFLVAPQVSVVRSMREERNGHRGGVFWFTGLSGAGKSTLAYGVEQVLFQNGLDVVTLDGDIIRKGLCHDLGFSAEDRHENLRRIAEVARLFAARGTVCLCAFIAPMLADRASVREIIGPDDYHELFVSCPLEVCERRDVHGKYALARQGILQNYTGVSAPYEIPLRPDLTICTDACSRDQAVARAAAYVLEHVRLERAECAAQPVGPARYVSGGDVP